MRNRFDPSGTAATAEVTEAIIAAIEERND